MISLVCLFAVTSGYMFVQNTKFENENRRLIIQNDSIISVNIELINALQLKPANKAKSTEVSLNMGTHQ
jgi:hypothetical protein